MSVPALGPFFSDDITGFLAEYGYMANPAGLPLSLMSATHRKQVGWEYPMQSKCQVNGVKNLTFSFGSASVKG